MTNEPRFTIGTQFKSGKMDRVCTIVDIYRTYSKLGNLVAVRYVATHEFMGQTIVEKDILEITVAKGLISPQNRFSNIK
jgi:hypothetical protein